MGRYRKIETKIWSDKKFKQLSGLQPSGQGLWLFLLSAPQTGPVPGLFHAGRASLAEELGWDQDDFDKAFKELENQGLVKADFKAKLIWLPNAIKYNLPESPNVVKSWANELEQLPECDLLFEAIEVIHASVNEMGESFQSAFEDVIDKALPNQEQEQEQERDTAKNQQTKKPEILDREPKNDFERVEKRWLENYIAIFGNHPINPRWDLSTPLISKALKQVGLEKVLQALETARQDDFCLNKTGYTLKVIMSGNVLSRLINAKPVGTGPPPALEGKKSLGGLDSW
jgi:hypothetical protein